MLSCPPNCLDYKVTLGLVLRIGPWLVYPGDVERILKHERGLDDLTLRTSSLVPIGADILTDLCGLLAVVLTKKPLAGFGNHGYELLYGDWALIRALSK